MRIALLFLGLVPIASSSSWLRRPNDGMTHDQHHPDDAAASRETQREFARRHLTFRIFEGTNNDDPLEDEGIPVVVVEDEDPLEDEGIPFFYFETDSASEDGRNHQAKDSVVKEAKDENESCSICGTGYVVTKPNANGINPMDLSVTCEQLENVAGQGVFTKKQCQMLVDMNFDKCGCELTRVTHGSTIETKSEHDRNQVPCSICGRGYGITNPDADGIDPDDRSITCGQIQEMAEAGKFTSEECEGLIKDADIFRACECQADPHSFHYEESDSSDEMRDDYDPPGNNVPFSKTVACSICGTGFAVTNPDAGIDPNEPSLTCGYVQEAAEDGKFTADECNELMKDFRVFTTCGCEADPLDEIRDKDPPDEDKPSSKPVSCSICGNGYVVSKPDADGIDPDEPSLTCGELQEAAEDGKFTAYECDELMKDFRLFSSCGCEIDPLEEASESYDPPEGKDLPFSDTVVCSICGKGFAVTNPDANGIDPDEESLTCGEVQEAAEEGKFTADECDELMNDFRLFTVCDCQQDPFYKESEVRDSVSPLLPEKVSCSICGNGYVVSLPDADGIDPDEPSLTCGEVQEAAEEGKFTAEECDELTKDFRLFATCGCEVDPVDEIFDADDDDDKLPPDEDSSRSQPTSCDICGKGYVVSKPDADGIDPEDPSLTCGEVQEAAEEGKFTADECDELVKDFRLFTTCGCIMDPLDDGSDNDVPTDKDIPSSPTVICSICGPGFVVSEPDADGFDPDDPSLTCGDVQDAAEDGKFTADECVELKNDVRLFNTCGCEPDVFRPNVETDEDDSSGDRSACSVCGAGFVVTMPNVDGIYYGGSSRTCGQVQEAAEDGKFTSDECLDLMNNSEIFVACGCAQDPAQSRTESRPTTSSNGGVDTSFLDDSTQEASGSGGVVVGGGGDCELSVTVKCVAPKDSGRDDINEEQSCAEYAMPELKESVLTPHDLEFKFQGGLCNADDAPQGANQYLCQDFNGGATTVALEDRNYIEALPPRQMGAVYYYQGSVQIGDTINMTNGSGDGPSPPLDEEILILVYTDSTKTTLLQMMIFQTNCKTDLTVGDSYGSLQLLSFSNNNHNTTMNMNDNSNLTMYKNVTVQVTITNVGTEDVYVDHAITFLEQSSREAFGTGEEDNHLVLRASGHEAVTLVHAFTLDGFLPGARIISLSTTVSGHDPHRNTCVAFGETSIVIPEHDHSDTPDDS